MKPLYFLIISVAVIAFFVAEGWGFGVLRFIVCSVISTGIVGAGFSTLVDVCANHPKLWESVTKHLLALPPKAEMSCPLGFVTAANRSHYPTSNGCGADGMKIGVEYLPYEDHVECCNSHDICYDKCHTLSLMEMNSHRTRCDLEFKSCLNWICTYKSWQRALMCPFRLLLTSRFWNEHCEQSSRDSREKKCSASVEVLYESVNSWGTSSYMEAQAQACVCIPA